VDVEKLRMEVDKLASVRQRTFPGRRVSRNTNLPSCTSAKPFCKMTS
jgi:hypothetical protein